MALLKKIIFLLLSVLSFSCKTKLEKQGWQRTAIVLRVDTLTINKKDKELVVVKVPNVPETDSAGQIINKPFSLQNKKTGYGFKFFTRNSAGNIISVNFGFEAAFKSDIAYYKWESDSLCLIKLLNNGHVEASVKFIRHNDSSASFQHEIIGKTQ